MVEQSDYSNALYSEQYSGQIERYFDENGHEIFTPSFAKRILIWRNMKKGIMYVPKRK